MYRVLVIGSSGAGKSMIACQIGQALGIRVHHLDERMWKDGCRLVAPEDELAVLEPILGDSCWILDGNYTASLPQRMQLADTVVWVDYPRELCLFRAIKRLAVNLGRTRASMGGDCRERLDLQFLQWIWMYPHRERPVLQRIIRSHGRHVQVIRLRLPHHARRLLDRLRQTPTTASDSRP